MLRGNMPGVDVDEGWKDMPEPEGYNPRQEWSTPKNFWDVLDGEFNFTLDAAARECNAKCRDYLDQDQDALKVTWSQGYWTSNRVYVNPGFSDLKPWVLKSILEVCGAPGGTATVVLMALVSPSTKWWALCVKYALEIRLLSPRVEFDPAPEITSSSNSRENCVVIFKAVPADWPGAHIWTWNWKEGSNDDDSKP